MDIEQPLVLLKRTHLEIVISREVKSRKPKIREPRSHLSHQLRVSFPINIRDSITQLDQQIAVAAVEPELKPIEQLFGTGALLCSPVGAKMKI